MARAKLDQDLTRVLKELDKADRNTRDAMRSAVYLEFVQMMRESLAEVPVDTGRLRSTAYVTMPSYISENISIEAGYATNYAVYVHENENAFHNPPTKAKFLIDPFERMQKGMAQRIAQRTKQLREKGVSQMRAPLFATSPQPRGDSQRVRVKTTFKKSSGKKK